MASRDYRNYAPSPAQKARLIAIHGAARRAYARHFPNTDDVAAAAAFWAAWHASDTLKLQGPLIRCGAALSIEPIALMNFIVEHQRLTQREPSLCAQAQADLEAHLASLDAAPPKAPK